MDGKNGGEEMKMKAEDAEKFQIVTCCIITALISACYANNVPPESMLSE